VKSGLELLFEERVLVHIRSFVRYAKVKFSKIFQETQALFGQKLTGTIQLLQERCRDTPTKGLSWMFRVVE